MILTNDDLNNDNIISALRNNARWLTILKVKLSQPDEVHDQMHQSDDVESFEKNLVSFRQIVRDAISNNNTVEYLELKCHMGTNTRSDDAEQNSFISTCRVAEIDMLRGALKTSSTVKNISPSWSVTDMPGELMKALLQLFCLDSVTEVNVMGGKFTPSSSFEFGYAICHGRQRPLHFLQLPMMKDVAIAEFSRAFIESSKQHMLPRQLHMGIIQSPRTAPTISDLLECKRSNVVELCVWGKITDPASILTSITKSLKKNVTLRKIDVFQIHIPSCRWDEIVNCVCNPESFQATFESNHSLQEIRSLQTERTPIEGRLNDDDHFATNCHPIAAKYLNMNTMPNVKTVRRSKILERHFSGDFHFTHVQNILPVQTRLLIGNYIQNATSMFPADRRDIELKALTFFFKFVTNECEFLARLSMERAKRVTKRKRQKY